MEKMNISQEEIKRLENIIYLLIQKIKVLEKIVDDSIGSLGENDPRKEKLDWIDGELKFWLDPKNF